ncbi:hypothetical protein Z043_114883 [Scleropages formosus]|uniref:Uncharacterized protein n=1 Tax=Scleropages formosus TaxID=113540 RepID=A0A0P7YHF3_SCLFO|nr:hypothetical protein Z043_114883 [Scleropages formosus]
MCLFWEIQLSEMLRSGGLGIKLLSAPWPIILCPLLWCLLVVMIFFTSSLK